jgi:glycolate oxidase
MRDLGMSLDMKNTLDSVFGKENVSFEDLDCLTYATDSSQVEGKSMAIIWPSDKEQIVELVRMSLKNKWNIVSRGGGSGLAGGCVPQDSIILDMSKMDSVDTPDKSQKTVVVEPGVILDDLNFLLKEYGLFFPVNPSSHGVCSVGGMVATNAAGNRAIRYGKTSNWVDELEIINGKGDVLNISGQEARDFAGTEGVLGIITRIKLRLTEPITERSISVLRFNDSDDMIRKVKELKDNKNILSMEFFDRLTAELSGLENSYHLFLEFGNHDGEIKDEIEIQEMWKKREEAGIALSSNGYIFMEDPKIPLDGNGLQEFMDWLETNRIPYFGHIGLGIIHQRFKTEQKDKIPEMFRLVQKLGGTVSGEHGIGMRKKEYIDRETANKIRDLKKQYDPYNILNRGKMI